jgi:hypothetical protein
MKIMFIDLGNPDTEIQIKDDEKQIIYKKGLKGKKINEVAEICVQLYAKHKIDRIEYDSTGFGEIFGEVLKKAAHWQGGDRLADEINAKTFGYYYLSMKTMAV